MEMKKTYYMFLSLCVFFSCNTLFFEADIEDTPENNFEILWKEFDRYYSHFGIKNVNWDSLYHVYRPQVTSQTTGRELFEVMSSMLAELRDGHVNLFTPYGDYEYTGWWKNYPTNYDPDVVKRNYLHNMYEIVGNKKILFGQLNKDLGYIHISSFEGETGWVYEIDDVLERFRTLEGIVIDVRSNGGGSTANSDYVASRFTDKKRLHAYFKYRDGPNHDDFTELFERYIEPSEKWRFTKPIAVLTNRGTFSAAETFLLAMHVLPHVVVIGDTTGGGAGNPVYRELPNGWTYRIPVWIELTPEKKSFEGIGLAPETIVWVSNMDWIMERDTILITAVQMLSTINEL